MAVPDSAALQAEIDVLPVAAVPLAEAVLLQAVQQELLLQAWLSNDRRRRDYQSCCIR